MKTKMLILALSCLALSACDDTMKTPNGQFPSEYLAVAQQYAGQYVGQVNRIANRAQISLVGNKPVLATAYDIVAPACNSKIGDMINFTYSKKDGAVKIVGAEFSFDPNLCADTVNASRLSVYFRDANSFEIHYLDHYETRWICGVYENMSASLNNHPVPPPYPFPPHEQCHWENEPYFTTGVFSK